MSSSKKTSPVKYSLNSKGAFVIDDYNYSKVFSNFFPGVAGLWGIPMWAFYVNRGQCISSFGIEDKDKSILEFQPANKAYRQTSLQGFRTFIKVQRGKKCDYWEPFQKNLLGTDFKKKQALSIAAHDLRLEETNHELGLKIKVNYFTMPDEPFSALVRDVSIKNLKKGKCLIEIIDGLPLINAFGLRDALNKNMSRTAEAWIKVRNTHKKTPFYQLNVEIADKPEVTHIKEGNFFFSFDPKAEAAELLDTIVEAPYVFGSSTDYSAPERFLRDDFKLPEEQKTENKTPSALSYRNLELKTGQEESIISLFGYAHDLDEVENIVTKSRHKGFIGTKAKRNKEIINEIRNFTLTKSSSDAFNMYSSHTFLDNVLRGGVPVSIKTGEGHVAFNVFNRKHGDLERDYNYFNLSPTCYSQGNGNYRDVNQNRRNDVWFNTDVHDHHIFTFLNLTQADGYNPLVVHGGTFACQAHEEFPAIFSDCVEDKDHQLMRDFFERGEFRVGELLTYLHHNDIKLRTDEKDFLGRVLEGCNMSESAAHGEGFWSDHWTYNLDLVESYFALYPDHLKELLIERREFTFYKNGHYVLPREQRYILTQRGVRQYASVAQEENENIKDQDTVLRTKQGEGEVYQTNLIVKLLCLITNKVASLDPSGIGVEMEADKPNWYDSLNGLPGLLGSSISETIEIKRFSQFILDGVNQCGLSDSEAVSIFEELATFIDGLSNLVALEKDPLSYWNKANDVKEHYRGRIKSGIVGSEIKVTIGDIKSFLGHVVKRIDAAMERAKDEDGFLPTYFYHEVTEYEKVDAHHHEGEVYVRPLEFQRQTLPLFLEGYVHALRVCQNKEERKEIYHKVRESHLFDSVLKMYKVNENLSGETEEIGRARNFPSGWLENESVWLHMEYKFMLELLRNELFEEYYDNFKHVLVPFQKPQRYGRSILENSSFIVSSAHEDPSLHGQGFVARLSGSTAEFIHMWLYMNVGKNPFSVNAKGDLSFSFKPALAGWLFSTKSSTIEMLNYEKHWIKHEVPKNTYAYNFLGGTLVVYHNPKRKDTFGQNKAKIKKIKLAFTGPAKPVEIKGSSIPAPYSNDLRERRVERVDVQFQ